MGRQTRQKLLKGLIEMYTDNQVAKYYDPSLLTSYGMRYILFRAVILILGFTAIAVPLVVLIA